MSGETLSYNPVGWFEIYVSDIECTKRFYEAVFETRLNPPQSTTSTQAGIQMYAFDMKAEGYGIAGALCQMDGVKVDAGGTRWSTFPASIV